MSTMVQMPVRVKPPPADIGEIISPGWASFEITTPANGARIDSVVEVLLRAARPARSATSTSARAAARAGRASASTSASAASSVGRPTTPSLVEQLARPLELAAAPRAGAPRSRRAPARPRRSSRLRERERRRAWRSSSRASTWPSRDRHPLLDEHLDHLAGDLRRDRRLPPRGDVARGVEHRGRPAGAGARLGHLGGAHRHGARAEQQVGDDRDQRQRQGHPDPGPSGAAPLGLAPAVDLQ